MKVETAVKELRKQGEFMGMSTREALEFIRANPLAVPLRAREAQQTYDDYSSVISRIAAVQR